MNLNDQLTSDFLIVAEGKEIAVHKGYLMSASPFLSTFLTNDPTCVRINANNARYDAMIIVLKYIYASVDNKLKTTGAVVLSSRNMNTEQLLHTAAPVAEAPHAVSALFSAYRYDFSVILSAWEIAMHFQLPPVSRTAVSLITPLLTKYTVVRALRSCLKHPKDEGAQRIRSAAIELLPPLLDTAEQCAEWKTLQGKYPFLTQLAENKVKETKEQQATELLEQQKMLLASSLQQQKQQQGSEWRDRSKSQPHPSPTPQKIARLQCDLDTLRDSYQRGLSEWREEELHMMRLLQNIDQHDSEVAEVMQTAEKQRAEASAAQTQILALQEEKASLENTLEENGQYVESATVYIPAAQEAVVLLQRHLATIVRRMNDNSNTANFGGNDDLRAMLSVLLSDTRTEKTHMNKELQEQQQLAESIKHAVATEKQKTAHIRDQLVELSR